MKVSEKQPTCEKPCECREDDSDWYGLSCFFLHITIHLKQTEQLHEEYAKPLNIKKYDNKQILK